ncbi:MAG: GHKL domain-containing protein, partial [Clostridiaceae bacterium]|nr:GHKL domain-containing protein [Clostridiaceae bacterium]
IFVKISFEEVMESHLLYLTAAVTSKIILIFILNTILRLRKSSQENIPLKYWVVLTSVPISSFILANVNAINDFNYSYERLVPVFFTLLILIFINVIIFVIFDEIIRTVELEKTKNAFSRQFNKQQAYYKQMIENNTNTRRIWHDMNNHFIIMQNLLELNELDKIKKYLGDLTKQVKNNGALINTGNLVIDSIVSEKKSFATKNNCDLIYEVNIPNNINLEPVDLCIILGNALDNAIEECQRIEDTLLKKDIILKIIYKNNQLFISVSNPMSGEPIKKDGRFVTKKTDAKNHGFGLRNIESIVLKYDGILDIMTENNIFKLNIALKIK